MSLKWKYWAINTTTKSHLFHASPSSRPPNPVWLSNFDVDNFPSASLSHLPLIRPKANPFAMSGLTFTNRFSLMDNYTLHSLEQHHVTTWKFSFLLPAQNPICVTSSILRFSKCYKELIDFDLISTFRDTFQYQSCKFAPILPPLCHLTHLLQTMLLSPAPFSSSLIFNPYITSIIVSPFTTQSVPTF